jgi:hypothetical protein
MHPLYLVSYTGVPFKAAEPCGAFALNVAVMEMIHA